MAAPRRGSQIPGGLDGAESRPGNISGQLVKCYSNNFSPCPACRATLSNPVACARRSPIKH
jgi:hypothetical protein